MPKLGIAEVVKNWEFALLLFCNGKNIFFDVTASKGLRFENVMEVNKHKEHESLCS